MSEIVIKPRLYFNEGIWKCRIPNVAGVAYGRWDGFKAMVDAYETWLSMYEDGWYAAAARVDK